jgi:phage gp45-like
MSERMEHLQYYHFPSQAQEGAEAMVMLAGDRDRIGCFTYQVNLTRALV